MGNVVTGPLAVVRDGAGKLRYYYQGTTLPADLPGDEVGRLVDVGLVGPSSDTAGSPAGGDTPTPDGDPDGGGRRPAQVAPKAAWVDWAVSQGASRSDAEESSKADLIELYGG